LEPWQDVFAPKQLGSGDLTGENWGGGMTIDMTRNLQKCGLGGDHPWDGYFYEDPRWPPTGKTMFTSDNVHQLYVGQCYGPDTCGMDLCKLPKKQWKPANYCHGGICVGPSAPPPPLECGCCTDEGCYDLCVPPMTKSASTWTDCGVAVT
jgi:hypothetical protein